MRGVKTLLKRYEKLGKRAAKTLQEFRRGLAKLEELERLIPSEANSLIECDDCHTQYNPWVRRDKPYCPVCGGTAGRIVKRWEPSPIPQVQKQVGRPHTTTLPNGYPIDKAYRIAKEVARNVPGFFCYPYPDEPLPVTFGDKADVIQESITDMLQTENLSDALAYGITKNKVRQYFEGRFGWKKWEIDNLIISLDLEVENEEGEITHLADLIPAKDDILARLEAKELVESLPKQVKEIAERRLEGKPIRANEKRILERYIKSLRCKDSLRVAEGIAEYELKGHRKSDVLTPYARGKAKQSLRGKKLTSGERENIRELMERVLGKGIL